MYAIIQSGSRQFRVAPGETLNVDKLDKQVGESVTFDKVLFVGGTSPKIGAPLVAGATVTATVKDHARNPKVLVFKYRRRKKYKVMRGHKQHFTTVEISNING